MKNSVRLLMFAAMLLSFLALPFKAMALVITPQSDTFGTLNVTFGGTGIPNNAVAITSFTNPLGGTVTLGLTATQRFGNPAVTNDGAGTFTATAGGDVLNGKPNYAQWNVSFYASGLKSGQSLLFLHDFDPTTGNNVNSLNIGSLNWNDSWNEGMSFLGGASFDPSAIGQYGFGLQVIDDLSSLQIGRTAQIVVNAQGGNAPAVPDTGNTVMMLGGALTCMGLVAQKYKKKPQTA